MTSSKTLRKIVSVGAALALALGGSLVATTPASAATPTTVPELSGGIGFDIKTATVSVASAATFTGGGSDTPTNYWLVCGLYSPNQYDWSANYGNNQTFAELDSGNCKIALSGNSLSDAITASTLNFSTVSHLYNVNTATSVSTVAGSLVDKFIVRYESLVSAGTVTAWAASMPGTLRGAVTTNPGVTGTATSGGSINLNSAIVWSSTPASTSYYLMQCDSVRNSGTELGEVNIPSLGQNFQLGCAPWSVSNNPVAYTTLPISLPAGLTAGKYLAIMISGNRTNYVTSSLSTAYSTVSVQQPSTYNLTFDLQGGAFNPSWNIPTTYANYSTGSSVNLSNRLIAYSPSRSDYSFNGWFSAPAGGTPVTDVTFASSDITVYAQWTAIGSNNNQVMNCAGQTGVTSYAASSSTLSPGGSYTLVYNGNPAFNGCFLPTQGFATARFFNGALLGSFYYSGSSSAVQVSQYAFTFAQLERLVGRPLVNGDVVSGKIWVSPGMTQPSQSSAGDFSYSVTITGVSGSTSTDSTDVAPEPLPVWASNIVSSIPTLTKALVSTGGSVALTGGDYADLKSVTIGGKAVAFKVETTGHVTIPVPAGEAGKTADIVIVFGGGTMVVQDGIKYVAKVDVAKVAERPIAIASGAKKITEAVADQIRQAAFASMNNNSISCVAYAANNTAKAKAAAKLTAVQACGIATKANPDLKASEIEVIVNKAKARQSAVGIKVYEATN